MNSDQSRSAMGPVGASIANLASNLNSVPDASARDIEFFSEVAATLSIVGDKGLFLAKEFIESSFESNAVAIAKRLSRANRPRFMKNEERIRVRRLKKPGLISSDSFYRAAAKCWSSLCFNNSSVSISPRLDPSEFKRIGCDSLAASAEKHATRSNLQGCVRLGLAESATILAREQGSSLIFKEGRPIVIGPDGINFCASAYPFFYVSDLAPPSVLDSLLSTESPELCLFDHHIVVMPTPLHSENRIAVDLDAVAKKSVSPLVLGEREGVCYFICRWP